MSQGFRKGVKIPEPSDTTCITPPARIDQQKNEKRAQQINHLHQQFYDLKKKIKEIESKNERIIDRIHTAYNFKKKNAYTEQLIHGGEESPGTDYQNRFDAGFSGALSVDAHSNKSDHSSRQIKLQKRSSQLPTRKTGKSQKFNLSVEYGKGDINMAEEDTMRQAQTQMRFMPNQLPPSYPQQSSSLTSVGSHGRMEKRLVDQLNQEKQILQQELNEKEEEVLKLQSSLKNNLRFVKGMLKQSLEQFEESVVESNMVLIEKALKKYQQKLKSVKTMALKVKDRQEDKKSSRLLEYGRQRRSQSKSRKSSPPRENSYYARESKVSLSSDLRDENKSRSKINFDQQQKHRKEFQQIANKYEQIIKSKSEQIQKYDKKYRAKERECYEMKMRIQVLQKRLAESEPGDRKSNASGFDGEVLKPMKNVVDSDIVGSLNSNVEIGVMEEEIEKLQQKINDFHSISNEKSNQISNLQNNLILSENKMKAMQSEFEQNVIKMKNKYQQEEQKYKRELERLLNQKNSQLGGLKSMLMAADKKFLEKECQFYGLESKIKKLQGLISSKETKIEELEKLVGDNCPTDRSIMLSSTAMGEQSNSQAIKKLKQEIEVLEGKIEDSRTEVFGLTKKVNYFKSKSEELESGNLALRRQVQSLQIQNEQLKINVNINNISAVMKESHHDEQDYENDDVANSLSGIDNEEKKQAYADIEVLTQKISESNKQKQQWYEKYQKLKSQNLEKESESIKLRSEVTFTQKQLQDYTSNNNKLKEENEKLRKQNKQLLNKLSGLEQLIEQERDEFKMQLSDIERKWAEFEDDMMRKSGLHNEGQKSQKSSVLSYGVGRNNLELINTQNQFLTLKLKEADAEIETLKTMEKKIIDEYQQMLEEYKIDARNKEEENRDLREEIEVLNNKIATLNLRLEVSKNEGGSNSRKQQKNQLIQRIEELQAELKQSKEINNKLTDMQGQLFEQIRIKQEQNNELYQELRGKEGKIHELEEVMEVRGEPVNTYASHMSQSTHKRESIKSQSSLKYSSHSQILRKSRMMNSSKLGIPSDEKGFDLELSQAGSEFYEQPSQISNISEFFDKEQLPYQKIKIKRHDQIKLFQKTASYIKSLKKAIDEKNKKLKLLQKKIESLKSSELVRKQIGLDIELREDRLIGTNEKLEADDTFRDYESVQLQYKRGGGYLRRYRQLEHDTKLVMEENNLLIQQIETLEEQLLKAEEQESSLVKIKDLYKQEIKKLIKKNEEQTKQFQQQLKNQRKRVEDSQSVHNIEAIKQLFAKIIQIAGFKFTEDNAGSKKKEEKRKQLQQYVKVMSNILKLDKKSKENLLAAIHK